MFFITNNINKNEPEILKSLIYIHIKAKTCGTQTIILSDQMVYDENISVLSQEEAQNILDSWIDEENLNPVLDIDGNLILQTRIDLNIYLR